MASFDSFVGSGDELSGAGGGGGGSQHGYMAFDSFRYSEDHSSPFEDGVSAGANGFGAPSEGDDSPLPPPPYAAAPPSSQGGGSRMSAFEDDDIGLQHSPDLTSSGFSSHPFDSVDHHHHGAEFPSLDDVSSVVDSNGRGSFVGGGGGGGGGFGQDEIDGSVSDSIFGFDPHSSSNGTGAVLPPLEEMQQEQGFQLREWRRQNAIRLAEKEKMEKEKLAQIVETADRFKEEFYSKRQTHCETSAKNNREKEKVYLANQESFHKNADKQYWKAVAELVPHELPTMEAKSRGKDKDKKKATTMVANNGPKPGKATDLSRMRQILVKLKHNLPDHMKPPPPPLHQLTRRKKQRSRQRGRSQPSLHPPLKHPQHLCLHPNPLRLKDLFQHCVTPLESFCLLLCVIV